MKTIGYCKECPISFSASAGLLGEGARFNDAIHCLTTGYLAFISKGLFRFKSHENANHHQQDCIIEIMAQNALQRI